MIDVWTLVTGVRDAAERARQLKANSLPRPRHIDGLGIAPVTQVPAMSGKSFSSGSSVTHTQLSALPVESGAMSEPELQDLEAGVAQRIEEAVAYTVRTRSRSITGFLRSQLRVSAGKRRACWQVRQISLQALNEALREEMEREPRLIMLGVISALGDRS